MKHQMLKIVLSDLIFLAALYTLTGCGRIEKSRAAHPISSTANGTSITPALNPGPVTVTVRGIQYFVLTAERMDIYSPWDMDHEVVIGDRSASPLRAKNDSCTRTIEIEFQGLATRAAATTIGDAFQPMIFYRPAWHRKGKDSDYLVIVKLNARPVSMHPVNYAPTEWASIIFGNTHNNRVLVPASASLKFDSPDQNNITVKRTETLNCANPKDNSRTETVEKIQNGQYFLGIGVAKNFVGDAKVHAAHSFNDKILCEIYDGCEAVPEGRKIVSTQSLSSRQRPAPRLVYAAFPNALPMMLAVENCAAGPAIVDTTSP